MTARLSRRDILVGIALTGVGIASGVFLGRGPAPAAAGATGKPDPSRSPRSPGTSLPGSGATTTNAPPVSQGPIVRAHDAEALLVATYEGLIVSLDPASVARLQGALADHRRHLDAFAAVAIAADASWSPLAVAAPRQLPRDLAAVERAASVSLLALLSEAKGDDAGLIASIAASEAAHAQVVGFLRHVAAR